MWSVMFLRDLLFQQCSCAGGGTPNKNTRARRASQPVIRHDRLSRHYLSTCFANICLFPSISIFSSSSSGSTLYSCLSYSLVALVERVCI
jgi:hypothetical protein